jgi:hypothetical protein
VKLDKQDFRQLRWPLLAASILFVAGAASLWFSERYLETARQNKIAAEKQRTAAQQRVAKASEEEREIRNHLVYFQRMADAGMIGTKNRLDLIEKIAAIKSQRKLFEIKYNIEAQKPVDYPGIVPTGAMEFVTSRMQLDMMLLHEEDLLNFLKDLQGAGQSLVSVRHCKMNRLERSASGSGLTPGVQAQCVLDLINLV